MTVDLYIGLNVKKVFYNNYMYSQIVENRREYILCLLGYLQIKGNLTLI